MRTNVKVVDNRKSETTHGGAKVAKSSAEFALTRSVLANMLFEDEFYEDGESNAKRIEKLVREVSPVFVGELAELARTEFKLRHIPLKLLRELARRGQLRADTLTNTIQRPDEIGEFLSIYWKDGKTPIANQVKKGLANAFHKFNEFQLSKWDKNSAGITLRDVMFLVHANPRGREALFKRIANQEMGIADTWETRLSAGANKKETFAELMAEGRLGALAFLRNLRNMVQSGISEDTIKEYSRKVNVEKVLPFRYIAAAKIVPQFTSMLEEMMIRSLSTAEKLKGKTLLVIDTSGSMGGRISEKSDLTRMEAAAALTVLARELCEDVVIYATAGEDWERKHATMRIPDYRGFALSNFITGPEVRNQIGGGGIFLTQCMDFIQKDYTGSFDRVIVFTDEQDCDTGNSPDNARLLGKNNYILNVGSYQNGINSKKWLTITGFSEATLEFIRVLEQYQN